MIRLKTTWLGCLLCLTAVSCASRPGWSGAVHQWGKMQDVLRDGQTQARVRLEDVTGTRTTVAVGALENLDGEITVLNGVAWIAQVNDAGVDTRVTEAPTQQATLLTSADVQHWTDVPLRDDVSADDLEGFVRHAARDAGVDVSKPFPFVVTGELIDLRIHVINGVCPMRAVRAGADSAAQPFRRSLPRVDGTLVGFFAENATGVMTHHGASTHVHAVLDGDQRMTGHVDSVSVAAGAKLRLPAGG